MVPGRMPEYHRPVPIYEFECGDCGERFEELVAAGTERTRCPTCDAEGAERRLSSFAFSRQLTPGQRRRLEDARGTDRGGARKRFGDRMAKARERRPKPPGGAA
jgi:putative FmdB family regulatory protein